jgi:hypothetical protein
MGYRIARWIFVGGRSVSGKPFTTLMMAYLTLMIICHGATARAAGEVTFPDTHLEGIVRAAIGKPTGTIYDTDLTTLTSLTAANAGITNLAGLQSCSQLANLDLTNNQIYNLGPLGLLDQLTTLTLYRNLVSDLRPLAGLTHLASLNLGVNSIVDLTPLAGLTNLHYLYLALNQNISDLGPLAGLTHLTSLYLHLNQISNLDPLAGLTELTTLNLSLNNISDLNPLGGLIRLNALYLNVNQIVDLTPLAGLADLGTLNIDNNLIADLGPLVANSGLGSDDAISLLFNPLSYEAIVNQIPALLARGIALAWNALVIVSITPSSAFNIDPPIVVEIHGVNFRSGARASLVKTGEPAVTAASTDYVSSSTLTCTFHLNGVQPGQWDLVVFNTDGGVGRLPLGFTVEAPMAVHRWDLYR